MLANRGTKPQISTLETSKLETSSSENVSLKNVEFVNARVWYGPSGPRTVLPTWSIKVAISIVSQKTNICCI